MELNKKIQIKIYNVESPGKFWFRTMSDAEQIKIRLEAYLEQCDLDEKYVPKKDDIGIVQVFNRNRIVRVKKISDGNHIVISILENGHKYPVSSENIIHLKDRELADLAINSVWTGSISDGLPAEKVCEFDVFFLLLNFSNFLKLLLVVCHCQKSHLPNFI